MTAVSRTARALMIAALAAVAVAGCAAGDDPDAAAPAACPAKVVDTYVTIGAVPTDAPDAAIYPERAPTPSCSFYFEPQDSTSIVITEADRDVFDAVATALEAEGYSLSAAVENAAAGAGEARVQVQLEAGPATGVLMLIEPQLETGFDSVSVVLLAVPTA